MTVWWPFGVCAFLISVRSIVKLRIWLRTFTGFVFPLTFVIFVLNKLLYKIKCSPGSRLDCEPVFTHSRVAVLIRNIFSFRRTRWIKIIKLRNCAYFNCKKINSVRFVRPGFVHDAFACYRCATVPVRPNACVLTYSLFGKVILTPCLQLVIYAFYGVDLIVLWFLYIFIKGSINKTLHGNHASSQLS